MLKKTSYLTLALATGLVGQASAAVNDSGEDQMPQGVEVPLFEDIQEQGPVELPEHLKKRIQENVEKQKNGSSNVITPDTTYGINFSQMGTYYIYSNNPEPILGSHLTNTQGGSYTTETTLLSNEMYVADFYHHNNSSLSGVKLGIAVKNTSSSVATLDVGQKAIRNAGYTIDMSTLVEVDYGKSTNYQTLTINPGETKVLMYTSLPNGYIGNGKIWMSTNSSGLKARVYFAHPNTLDSKIFSFPQATSSYTGFTSGTFKHSQRQAWIDANTYYPGNTFYLSSYEAQGNTNEYEYADTVGNTLLGRNKIMGNYGVEYWVGVKNSAGRKLNIYPNLTSPSSCSGSGGRIALWTQNTGWYTTSKITTAGSFWSMALPAPDVDGYSYFAYVLPGGACGNVKFEVQ
ncbi:hypothetical protein [Brevibacillus dissolubilis]|uniref:hypothetical protein n=1 Tax=Brevibacillus dissolubilis TaxID=1844116 RepID=UPI0011168DBB|nr:hypothetical protein [Brevibacillus dissolubilis]